MKNLVTAGYGFILFFLGMVSSICGIAFAQTPPDVRVDPMLVDLSTLGMPGALVIIAWMYKDNFSRLAGSFQDLVKAAATFLERPRVTVYTPSRRGDDITGEIPIP